jgi:hypothetical protein
MDDDLLKEIPKDLSPSNGESTRDTVSSEGNLNQQPDKTDRNNVCRSSFESMFSFCAEENDAFTTDDSQETSINP